MKSVWTRLSDWWCRSMHPAPMWPVNGYYRCPTCLRAYPVPWEDRSNPVRSLAKTGSPSGAQTVTTATSSGASTVIAPALSR